MTWNVPTEPPMNPTWRTKLLCLCFLLGPAAGSTAVSSNIVTDQFGYRPNDPKWVIFAQPVSGTGSPSSFTPGTTFEVRRVSDNGVAFTGSVATWNSGNADTGNNASSGDRGWQGDFSGLTTSGDYYISVPGGSNPGSISYNFSINSDIYNPALLASTRMYYYQRCGTGIDPGHGGAWNHPLTCHMGNNQDLAAHLYVNGDQGQARDVHGGWHDAGDERKYVPFMTCLIWDLLHAFEWNPCAFGDESNIPESGNGVPDILDEIKWELDWIQRMQITNASDPNYGAVYAVVGVLNGDPNPGTGSPPNLSTAARYYTGINSWATGTLAFTFANAARLFAPYSGQYPGYAAQLQNSAMAAWNWMQAHTTTISYDNTNFAQANANFDAGAYFRERVATAAELFYLTGDTTYRDFFDANYNNSAGNSGTYHPISSSGFWSTDAMELERGMVDYCLAPGATASVVTAIKNALRTGVNNNQLGGANNDLYRSYMWDYWWGSNAVKCDWGNLCLWAVKLNVDSVNTANYWAKAEDYLHYIHGVNPLGWVYLTNMGTKGANAGAEKSVDEIFHGWFADGTVYDGIVGSNIGPAPGIMPGGPNHYYENSVNNSGGTAAYPPAGQPPQKCYLNWNTVWPDCSWEITEPSTGYQSAYVFLASHFASCAGPTPTPTLTPTSACGMVTCTFTITRTPTRTPSPTVTRSPTRTYTPSPCDLMYDGDTSGYQLSNGTVHNGGDGTLTETSGAGRSGNGMRLTYTSIAGWWQEHWWDMTTNKVVGSNTYLTFSVRRDPSSPGGVSQFLVRINWTGGAPDVAGYLVEGGIIDTTWKTARIPLADLLETGQTSIDFIEFIASWDTDYTVDVDDICLTGLSLTPTRTNTQVSTNTWTATMSNTATGTSTSTRTLTSTRTFTLTHTRTNTLTSTPSSTRTQTPMNTNTPTITLSPTLTPTGTLPSTSTHTRTRTLTHTLSPTLTHTYTLTPTETSTPTPTRTPTLTWTFSMTPTASMTVTPSLTASLTPTRTPTASSTASWTATSSLSPSWTPSPSLTVSSTDTPTASQTVTVPELWTPTRTITRADTATATASPVMSETNTVTHTETTIATRTPTITSTGTLPPTSTNTFTGTPAETSSMTLTLSPTATPSPSSTMTWTETSSLSETPTVPAPPSATFSPTPSETQTTAATATQSSTSSPTRSATASFTASFTPTSTQTSTPVFTSTHSPTWTPSPTGTPTYAFTPTETASVPSLTPTPPTTPDSSLPTPNSTVVPYPNPCHDDCSEVTVNVRTTGTGERVKIQLYTTAYRKVNEVTLFDPPVGVTAVKMPVKDKKGGPLSNGVYYVVVMTSSDRAVGKLLVLR